jgi:hypothetical protein
VGWDFLQRYDESWIWRCAEGRTVRESTRNFAALEECVADAVRHGYSTGNSRPVARMRAQQASRRRKAESSG